MNESSNQFRNFAARLLEHEGALVDTIEPEGLEAMLPEALHREWRAPEMLRLGFGPELPAAAERASLESDWLERFHRLLGDQGRWLKFVAGVDIPPISNIERIVEHSLTLPNAVYRVMKSEPAWTRYELFVFRYTAVSDEKREGLLRCGFNLANASPIDPFVHTLLQAAMDPALPEAAVKPAASQLPAEWPTDRMKRALSRALPFHVQGHLGPFVQSMQRRLDRDLARLHEYFNGLREEAHRKLKRGKTDSAKEQLRIEAAEREYQAKVGDLRQKYDLHVKIAFVQRLELLCPVQRITIVIKRRKGERKLALDWNPIARALDPAPCEWSYVAAGPRIVCDDHLHLVRPEGHGPCANCGKEYCRVCAPRRCPKCGRETAMEGLGKSREV